MRLSVKLHKIIEEHTIDGVLAELLDSIELEKLLLGLSNKCVNKAYHQETNKLEAGWMGAARIFHRACDEIKFEKAGKNEFTITRKDTYECPKCKNKFKVDAAKEENAKFDLSRSTIIVTCPNCGKSD